MQLLEEGNILGIATAILVAGIAVFLLLFVPYIRETMSERISGRRPLSFLVILFFIVLGVIVLASWIIFFAMQWSWILFPVVLITLVFRAAAPYLMWDEIHKKHGHKKLWNSGISLFEFVSFVLVAYSLYTAYSAESNDAASMWQDVIMFFTVLYNYSRMYLKLFMPFIKDSEIVLNWVSVFLISLSFIILLPVIFPEFHIWYKISNATGWFIGLVYLRKLDARSSKDENEDGDERESEDEK